MLYYQATITTLPGNDYEFGKNPAGDSSRGVYVMNTDSEKEESEDNK